jgi:hypothetical protein
MAVQSFTVFCAGTPIWGYALGCYYPLWVKAEDGAKAKNPKFDKHSQQILNLKQANTQWYKGAVNYCGIHLAAFLKTRKEIQTAEFVIVSSVKGQVSSGLEDAVKLVCKIDKRFSYTPHALRRTSTIDKLARGGDRSLSVHLRSLEYLGRQGSPSVKIVLDDVTTTGHSLEGAMTVMHQVMSGLTFIPVVLGKTTHD